MQDWGLSLNIDVGSHFMKKYTLLILFGFFSCHQDTTIRISDLRFPDASRAFFRDNQIDTTFIFTPQEDGREIKILHDV
jgi:hypothetical protein